MVAIRPAQMDIGVTDKIIIANLVTKHAPNVMVHFLHNAKDVLTYLDPMTLVLLPKLGIFLSVLSAKFQNVQTVSISSGTALLVFVTNAILHASDV